MQFGKKIILALAITCLSVMTTSVSAEPKGKPANKTYTEDEFITAFQGKSRKAISASLGAPVKKEQSVKPTGAEGMLAGKVKAEEQSKPVNVEMWYYKNVVQYAPKKTYKQTELTFVNDRCMNIAFFNEK